MKRIILREMQEKHRTKGGGGGSNVRDAERPNSDERGQWDQKKKMADEQMQNRGADGMRRKKKHGGKNRREAFCRTSSKLKVTGKKKDCDLKCPE